jgi:hypothetical protein
VVKCTQKTAICIPSHEYQFHTWRSHICSNTTQKNISIIDMNSVPCHVTIAQSLLWLLQTRTRIPIVHTTSLDLWIANRLTRTVHKDTSKVQWFQNHYYSQKIANKVQSRGQLTSMPLNGQSCSKKSRSGIQQASIYTLLHMQLAQKQTRSPMKTELPQDNQQITVLNLRHITQKESSDSPGLICFIGFLHCKHWDAWPSVTALVIAHKGSAGSTENQTAAPANQHWDPTNRP